VSEDRKYKVVIPDMNYWRNIIPCQAACPVHTDAGRYVQLIAEGRYEDSYLTARSPNSFASVCGRVCAAPCEDFCRRGRIDEPVSIRALKRFVTERYGVESMAPDTQDRLFEGGSDPGNKWRWHMPVMVQSRKSKGRGQKVAVIGAGPAGLACAHDLAVMGYQVTIFEATGQPGGMMVHGIPEFRLSRAIINKEIDRIQRLGVEIRLNTPLKAGYGLKELRSDGFKAFFVSVGVQKGRDLNIPGGNLDGVVKAIDYLINANSGYRMTLGNKVP
jgi:NADPH-dependent glutamate synthase beta subunit-like oxidoreductase